MSLRVHFFTFIILWFGFFLSANFALAGICGIDSLFTNGYESKPATYPTLNSSPGAISSPGIAQSITGPNTFSIAITYPSNGAAVNGVTTAVAGTITGPTNTGVVINGVQAYVSGTQFLATAVAVSGVNTTLTATGTKLTGETTTATVTVSQSTPSPISLIVGRSAGFAPLRVVFTYTIGNLPNNGSVQYIGLDYTADGTDEVINPSTQTNLYTIASMPGVYRARLTVKDNNNASYTSDAHYIVRNAPELSGMLCDEYEYMKQQLSNSNISAGLNAIHPNARSEFQTMFTNAGTNLLPYVANLGSIVAGTVSDSFVSYLIVRENSDQTLSGYHMEFSQDATGVWRISDM